MRTVSAGSVAAGEAPVEALPVGVQEALGELAGAAKEGLLALSVGVGLGVLHELMEAEVDEVVGPKGRHDPNRDARSEEHTSELQSPCNLVCRLLLEKKKQQQGRPARARRAH